ncbi:hypothetical protein [Bradyrhizobium sp. CB2312]|uniref:hypothetical protein n=1 Tax=Bradyrhizobium sp. CB2312 TaxID=3039155 RepID=UPI0024B13788|nr:hypothetical protein [Bradyrhizobium sp. CB2312]WFU74060.1 hypothetical protein QA642_08365 [Bradyrhizobium sp. CB2312]
MIPYALAILPVAGPAQALAEDSASGLALWSKIHEVFSHPRCANCHVGTDRVPMWSGPEYGATPRPHGMHISAKGGDDGINYLACTTCHSKQNSLTPHGPPGATSPKGEAEWQLAPVKMQWFGKSSAEICKQFKDPDSNGDRKTITELVHHVTTEPLVRWAWTVERERRPPHSAEQLGKLIEDWGSAGAPCP